MCTVTYLPLKNGFILTTNRDESPERGKALMPKKYYFNDTPLVYPKDPVGTGSWVISSYDYSLCLLNGAFEKHERKLPYRMSRGKVLIDFFKISSIDFFFNEYSLAGIEPFTVIIIENTKGKIKLYELAWDGNNKHLRKLNPEYPHIRASSTLYNKRMKNERHKWFHDWIKENPVFTQENIINFHMNGGNGNPHEDLKMDRDVVKTLSTTSILKDNDHHKIRYFDFIDDTNSEIELPLLTGIL